MVALGIFKQDLWIFSPVFLPRYGEGTPNCHLNCLNPQMPLVFCTNKLVTKCCFHCFSVLFIYFYFLTCNETEKKPNNFRRGYFFSRKKNNNKPGRVWGWFFGSLELLRHLDMTGFPGIMTTENITFRAEVGVDFFFRTWHDRSKWCKNNIWRSPFS